MSTNAGSVRRNARDSLAANHEDQLILDDSIPFDDEHQPVSAPATPAVADMSHNNNTVIQEAELKHRGRKPSLCAPILALLREYPDGLTVTQLKVYLNTEKHIGDTLAGMVKAQLLVKDGSGQAVRYRVQESV